MADCTISVEWVKKPTYSDVKKLYECFEYAVTQMAYESISLHFNFKCGSMRYVVKSIEEFTETAFGETDFKLTALQFQANLPDKNSVRINYLCDLTVSASSKVLLETFKERLNLEMKVETELTQAHEHNTGGVETHAVTPGNGTQVATNSPITINGSGNIVNVAGGIISGNQIESEQKTVSPENKPSGIKEFMFGVMQEITANAVWALLGLIGTALLACFALN